MFASSGHAFWGKGVEAISRPDAENGPTQIETGIFVLDVNSVNTPGQSFAANVFLVFRWKDHRLAHDAEGLVSYPLEEVWNPQLQIINRQNIWEAIDPVAEVTSDGTVTVRYWFWGNFSQPLDLADFPFDKQEFNLRIVSIGSKPEELEFVERVDAESGVSETLSVADWNNFEATMLMESFKPMPGGPEVAGVVMHMTASRLTGYYWVKVILPLILVVMLSWAVLWIDPTMPGTQISMAITAMLTLIAYRFSIGTTLPNLSYLTRLDYFVLTSTILVFLTLVEVVIASTLTRLDRGPLARRIEKITRICFPLALLGFLLDALILV